MELSREGPQVSKSKSLLVAPFYIDISCQAWDTWDLDGGTSRTPTGNGSCTPSVRSKKQNN